MLAEIQMDEEDLDTHICLSCQATIIGLGSYIQHKKFDCPAKKTTVQKAPSSVQLTTTTPAFTIASPLVVPQVPLSGLSTAAAVTSSALSIDVSAGGVEVEATLAPSALSLTTTANDTPAIGTNTFSPTSSRVVDPNMVLYNTRPTEDTGPPVNWSEFFSSLELQSRGLADKQKADPVSKDDPDQSKTLRIVNLLNDLDFSSDSEGFLPSDAEDLLNFSDVDDMDEPPHTGGKWKPGSHPPLSHTRGKWKPGTKPMQPPYRGRGRPPGKGRGKNLSKLEAFEKQREKDAEPSRTESKGKMHTRGGKRHVEESDEEDEGPTPEGEQTVMSDVSTGKPEHGAEVPEQGKVAAAAAEDAGPETQLGGTGTDEWAPEQKYSPPEKKAKMPIAIQCHVCSRTFNNKYGFVRHLATTYHIKREKVTNPPYILEESFQKLLLRQKPFQCRLCSFFCNDTAVLSDHLSGSSHVLAASAALGPLLCVRCKFSCKTNDELLEHLRQGEHARKVAESKQPCVIREIRKEIACPTCKVVKHSAMALAKHMKVSHGNCLDKVELRNYRKKAGIFSKLCPHCGKQCANHQVLTLHIRRRHTMERPYHCTHCNVHFAESVGLRIHLNSKSHAKTVADLGNLKVEGDGTWFQKSKARPGLKCRFCTHRSASSAEQRVHVNIEHPDKVHYCNICGISFDRLNLYKRHLAGRDHKRQLERSQSVDGDPQECSHCGKKFYDNGNLKLHMLQHTGITTENKLKELSGNPYIGIAPKYHNFVNSLSELCRKNNGRSVECPECKLHLRYENIIGHLRKHSGSMPFECVYCGKHYTSSYFLKRHLKTHLGLNVYKCDICSKEFKQRVFLRTHKMRAHKDPELLKAAHKCTICGSSYIHKNQLRLHMLRHTGKPIKCTWPGCRQSFIMPSELESHMRVHTNTRPYLCDLCGYSAKMKNQLTRHRRRHTGERAHPCEYCDFKAINSTNLRRHMRIHIGTKPFKCPHCDYRCNTIENVRKHIKNTKKHAGLSVYPCKLCSFATDSSNDFRAHLADVHEIKAASNAIISVYCGIYEKETDIRRVPEGSQALPCRDTSQSQPKQNKPARVRRKARVKGLGGPEHPVARDSMEVSMVKVERTQDDHAYSTAGISYMVQDAGVDSGEAITEYAVVEQVEVETSGENTNTDMAPVVYYASEDMSTVYIVKEDVN